MKSDEQASRRQWHWVALTLLLVTVACLAWNCYTGLRGIPAP